MSKVDQFESVFRSALHDVFVSKPICFSRILVVSDLATDAHADFIAAIKSFSKHLDNDTNVHWLSLAKNDYQTTPELLERIKELQVDLIFTYRNLHSDAWQYSHSLGEHLDVLIQKTTIPVLVVPHPLNQNINQYALQDTNVVMALTDHLSADNDLVNYAVKFTENEGHLYLMHIEDAHTFEYYLDVISKIASIDTDEAREDIATQLLKAPNDYIHSVENRLKQENFPIQIHKIITFGQHLTEYRRYIEEHDVDLLVMNTKDKNQMAMHGLAYPLVVELRSTPLLLI